MSFRLCLWQLILMMGFALACSGNSEGATGQITVAKEAILRDGRPWVAKGVVVVGMIAPANVISGPYAEARKHFGPQELDAIAEYGADLVRFQVSQAGSDPKSSIYSPDYVGDVERAVHAARAHGFAVIVSLQAQKQSGLDEGGMPSPSTSRAWAALVPLFRGDDGVMLELFNEPAPEDGRKPSWAQWRVAMDGLISEVRALEAHNVVIADGLQWATTLDGAPLLSDPTGQIVYAIHPYPYPQSKTQSAWDRSFGERSGRAVMVTEWNAISSRNCSPDLPAVAQNFLSYLRDRHVGLVGWAFDLPGTLVKNYRWDPTDFAGFRCGPHTNFGAGELIHKDFESSGAD